MENKSASHNAHYVTSLSQNGMLSIGSFGSQRRKRTPYSTAYAMALPFFQIDNKNFLLLLENM